MKYYKRGHSSLISQFNSNQKEGLNQEQIEINRVKYGKNAIDKKDEFRALKVFFKQFDSILIYILIFACILSYLVGEAFDALIIGIIIVFNAVLGFFQEMKAQNIISELKKISALKSKVIRNGTVEIINSDELVVGDILILEEGNVVGADARIIESFNLHIDQSSLTGESQPVSKDDKIIKKDSSIADQNNMVFSSCQVTKGKGLAIVTSVGIKTEIGKIVELVSNIEEEETPLQKNVDGLAKQLAVIVGIISILILIIKFYTEPELLKSLFENNLIQFFLDNKTLFLIVISLAVASIPEGLPAILTMTLAFGIKRMAREKALVRNLPSVETLGECNVICTDKTGTLTLNQMTVTKLWVSGREIDVTGNGYEPKGNFLEGKAKLKDKKIIEELLEIGFNCNDSNVLSETNIIGDPTEKALIVSYLKAGKLIKKNILEEFPFDSSRKMMSVLIDKDGKKILHVKGAPEVLLENCSHIIWNGKKKKLTQKLKDEIDEEIKKLSSAALRVLGFAKKLSENINETNLTFVGLQAMIDPPRKEVIEAIKQNNQAGIRSVMITGDNILTATAIAKKIGLHGKSMLGSDFASLNEVKRKQVVTSIAVFARVEPEHKLLIVKALQDNNNIVAMTGDGVNDSPSLKQSDIGIAMNITGTDVAKQSSDMVLLDDNYATMVKAVKEGRTIHTNLKKFINFLLACNLGEVLVIIISLIAKIPLPFTAIHILWLNLITDGLPALALGLDPPSPDILKQPPKKRDEKLVTANMAWSIGIVSIVTGLLTVGVYLYDLSIGNAFLHASTMALTGIIIVEFFQIFSIRKNFDGKLLPNKYLTGSLILSILFQCGIIYTPLNQYFGLTPISLMDWGLLIIVGFVGYLISEVIFRLILKINKI